jgi:hypothetical protein
MPDRPVDERPLRLVALKDCNGILDRLFAKRVCPTEHPPLGFGGQARDIMARR